MIKLILEKNKDSIADTKQSDLIYTPERKPNTAIMVYVAISFLAIGLFFGLFGSSYFDSGSIDHDNDQQIVDPDKSEKQSSNKVEAAGSTFVFVYEFQTKTADQELLVRDLRAWSQINKCEYRQFDGDSKDAEPYKIAAEKAGMKAPFLAVVRDKKIVRVFDWPRDRTTLESLVK
jgi:hypothetical protein